MTAAVTTGECPALPRSWRHLLTHALVKPDSADPVGRRSRDVGVLIGSCVLLGFIALRSRSLSGPDVDIAVFLNGLDIGAARPVTLALRFGSLWVVPVVASVGALSHRWRLSGALLLAGGLAWSLGRALAWWYGEHSPPPGIVVRTGGLQEFPLVRIAVAVAVVSAAAPYVTRLVRRTASVLIAGTSVAAVGHGIGLPSAVAAGLLLGWASAAIVHLLFGSPAGRPRLDQIGDALRAIGVSATGLRFATSQDTGGVRVVGRATDGVDVSIRAYGRDEQGAQLLSKLWRFVWYEDSGPTLHVTRLQHVEHQAYAMLLAQHAGAAVPEVIAATTAGPTAVLVERRPPGLLASELDAALVSDEVLDGAWQAVMALRRARVAHGALDLTKLLVADEGPVQIVEFDVASTSASDAQLDADAARLLAASAVVVGPDRAVAAARKALGAPGVVATLPHLQPPVLTDAVRHTFRHHRGALAELRAAAAANVGAELPPLVQLERVRPRSVALAVFTFIGAYALLGQLGSFGELAAELRGASWGWVLVAAFLSTATNIGYAMAYVGSTTARLPFGRSVELQVAGSFTNLVAPNGLGTAAINARFLQVRGVPMSAALASLFVNTAGSAIAEVGLFLTVLPLAGSQLDLGRIPWRGVIAGVLAVGLIVVIVGAVTWRVPRARSFITGHGRSAFEPLHDVLRSPAKLSLIIGGQVLVQLLYATALGAACLTFGATVPLSTLLLVNVGTSAISGLVPTPGGLGVAEATLAGGLAATGMPSATAISIALTYRLVTTWIPWLPGLIALRSLEREDAI